MELSIVVCAYAMQRELPRTIYTLSRRYQRDVEGLDYEIIVLDNGSPEAVDEASLRTIASNLSVVRVFPAIPSPASAINVVMRSTRSRMLGYFIDGARLASPGLIARACDAYRCDNGKVIGSLSFHLGPDVQRRSVAAGYTQTVEDDLLAATLWEENGYALFGVSVLAGSSYQGWFGCIGESNGVFLDRALWEKLGGLDERFKSPGGGLVNLDFWERAVGASENQPWLILGEGTFHQVHGGVATNGTADDRQPMYEEYINIRGKAFSIPCYRSRLIGSLNPDLLQKGMGSPNLSIAQRKRSWRRLRDYMRNPSIPSFILSHWLHRNTDHQQCPHV